MNKLIILLAVMFCFSQTFAQKNSDIKGFLTDSTDQPLVGASAILYFQKDSLFTGFGLTDESGKFQINNVAPGEYYLQLSYVGYVPENKALKKEDFTGVVDLGRVPLKSNTDLEAIVVNNAPLEIKKDTIVYDADAFRTKENATVEDLLKKLPGIEVEDDGTIKAQGEEVKNVLVDGKKFFGDDPKIATQNLPADAVKNVQVYDKKSEKAEFTGVDDGQEEKTVNIELKEDRKNGYFGNIRAGGGFDPNNENSLFDGKALLSRYSPGNQLSFIASGNNVNDRAFSYRDYFAMSGQSFGGRGRRSVTISSNSNSLMNQRLSSGINRSMVTGANWNTNLGEKVEMHTDYFFNQTNNNYFRDIKREFFQSAGGLTLNESSNGEAIDKNHRLNLDFTAKLNKKNELKIENRFSFANTDDNGLENSITNNSLGTLSNTNKTTNKTEGDNLALATDLFWKHRFEKEGRSLFTNFNFQNTTTDQLQNTLAETFFAESNQTNLLNQDLVNDYKINTWGGDITYTEPIKKDHYLELNYKITNDGEDRQQNFYDLTTGQRVINNQLTNGFNRDYTVHRPGLSYKIMGEKHDFTFNVNHETAQLDGKTSLSSNIIDKNFTQILPGFRWNWEIKDGQRFSLNYSTYQRAPSVNQLQPATNNTNPLNIYVGNPNLEASNSHSFYTNLFSFDRFTFTNFFVNAGVTFDRNSIVNSQSFDANGVQTTTPVNIDGQTSIYANMSWGKPIRAIRMRVRTGIDFDFTDGMLFLNGQENDFTRLSNSLSLSLDNTNDEKVEYGLRARINQNNSKYSENERNNQDYLNQFYRADFEYRGIESWRFGTDFNYNIYGQATERSQRQELPIWEASVSKLFADNLGEVKFTVYDILNKNTGISQTQNLNYAQEEISNTLARYGMMSLTWKIMDKAAKQDKEAAKSGPPMPPPPPEKGGNKPEKKGDATPPPPPPPGIEK